MKKNHPTPFPYIVGPHYVYELMIWDDNKLVTKYVGRGRGRRAKSYFRHVSRNFRRYLLAPTHNRDLTTLIQSLRLQGKEIMPIAHDCGSSLAAAKSLERALIAKHGRVQLGTGTLLNRNAGG